MQCYLEKKPLGKSRSLCFSYVPGGWYQRKGVPCLSKDGCAWSFGWHGAGWEAFRDHQERIKGTFASPRDVAKEGGEGGGEGKNLLRMPCLKVSPRTWMFVMRFLQPEGHQVPQAEQEQPPEQDAMPVPPKRKSRAKAKAKASAEPSGESAVPKAKAKAKAKSGTRGKKRQVDNGDNGDSQIEPKPKRKQRRPIHDAPNPVPLEKRDEMKQFPVIVYITIFFWFGCVLNNCSNKLRLHML